MKTRIPLRGCAPEPLIHYLKALGILRLVAEQLDPQVRAAWQGDTFVLETNKSEDELLDFFLNHYRPTPIVAPWNMGSGFHVSAEQAGGSGKKATYFRNIEKSIHPRVESYRQTIAVAKKLLADAMTPQIAALSSTKKSEALKPVLLPKCRAMLTDEAVKWIDAVCVLAEDDDVGLFPLLGSGGNDGNFEFSLNFMGRIHDIIPADGKTRPHSKEQLTSALFADRQAALIKAAVGQFYPAGAGAAPNASNAPKIGSNESLVNPWDFVLALEGSLILASAAVRRLAAGAKTKVSFPFTVQKSVVGYGTAVDGENVRAELWLPLWSRSSAYTEIAHIFKEGRVQFDNRRQVRTGFDFARAIAELGVDKGIDAFQRYAFIERNGDSNLATPLGIFYVQERPLASLVQEIDRYRWLETLTRATSGEKKTPLRFVRARKQIEEAVFKLCARGEAEDLRETFVALGVAEAELANGEKFRDEAEKKNLFLRPLAGLSLRWLYECDDKTPEFKIAAALAAISGEGNVGVLRSNLEPFDEKSRLWAKNSKSVVWTAATLEENLAAVLQRRSIDARMHSLSRPPLTSSRSASLKAVADFLSRETDDERIKEFLRALILLDWSKDNRASDKQTRYVPPTLPRAYALLKLLFLPEGKLQIKQGGDSINIKHEPTVVPLLRALRVEDAPFESIWPSYFDRRFFLPSGRRRASCRRLIDSH
jgi:CRISPR-associated protein Csx17